MTSDKNSQCECGKTTFRVHGKPLMRGFCHCTICQAFNDAPFADITLFRARDVSMPSAGQVDFQAYRPPPAVQRGKCHACAKPAIESLHLFPMPKLIIVPTRNIREPSFVPEPSMHFFYNRRVADIEDGLPKHSGYLRSQGAFMWQLFSALRGAGSTA